MEGPSNVYHPTVISKSMLSPTTDWFLLPTIDDHQKPHSPALEDEKCKNSKLVDME